MSHKSHWDTQDTFGIHYEIEDVLGHMMGQIATDDLHTFLKSQVTQSISQFVTPAFHFQF